MTPHAAVQRLIEVYPEVRPSLIDEALLMVLHQQVTIHPGDPLPAAIDVYDSVEEAAEPYVVKPDPDLPHTWYCACREGTPTHPCIHTLAGYLALEVDVQPNHDLDPGVPQAPLQRLERHDPHSLTVKAQTAAGFEVLLCLRGYDEKDLFLRAATLIQSFEAKGWKGPYGGRHPSLPQPTTTETAPQTHAAFTTPSTPQQSAPPSAPLGDGKLIFHAETLQGNFLNGRWYWAVFGPDMPRNRSKHGVRIWEEGLATAGFNLQTLDAQRPPSLQGYLAEYVLDAKGGPDKIIRLWKPTT